MFVNNVFYFYKVKTLQISRVSLNVLDIVNSVGSQIK